VSVSGVRVAGAIHDGASVLMQAQAQKPRLLRDPSVSKTQIAFSYAAASGFRAVTEAMFAA